MPAFGAGTTGPANEAAETVGTQVNSGNYPSAIDNASAGDVLLIRAGTYSEGFTIPAGTSGDPTVVKPYNAEAVTINHTGTPKITMDDFTTIAGLTISATSTGNAIKLTKNSAPPMTDVIIRNCILRGGTSSCLVIARNLTEVDVTGNDIDGGDAQHCMKVDFENTSFRPDEIRIVNNLFHKDITGSGTDELQLDGHQDALVDHCTFRDGATENGLDVKASGTGGGVTVTFNYFDGATITQAVLLVNGDVPVLGNGDNIVTDNHFDNNCTITLGANLQGPTWFFKDNLISGATSLLKIQRAFDARIIGNTMTDGGTFELGQVAADNQPRDSVIVANSFTSVELKDRATPNGFFYTCKCNVLVSETGDWANCKDKCGSPDVIPIGG